MVVLEKEEFKYEVERYGDDVGDGDSEESTS